MAEEQINKLNPSLDELMLTQLKIQQIRKRGAIVPDELFELRGNIIDQLAEIWFNTFPEKLKYLNQ